MDWADEEMIEMTTPGVDEFPLANAPLSPLQVRSFPQYCYYYLIILLTLIIVLRDVCMSPTVLLFFPPRLLCPLLALLALVVGGFLGHLPK